MNQHHAELQWLRLARRSTRKINFAWWLQAWAPIAVFAALIGFTLVFYLRSTGYETHLERAWPWLAVGFAIACFIAGRFARPNYSNHDRSLVRLESKLGLNNALTAARAGVAPWPDLPTRPRDGLAWRPGWLLAPPLLAIVLLASAFIVPITPQITNNPISPAEPGAWARVENVIDRLQEDQLAEPEDLARVRDRVEQLRATPESDWFSADTLEASASLESAFGAGLTRMGRDLARADQNLGQLAKFGDQMTARAKARAAEEFSSALKNLESGKLKPNKALLDKLKGIDPSALDKLPPEQLAQLRERLQRNAEAMRRVAGRAGAEESPFGEGNSELGPDGGQGGEDDGEGGNGGLNEGPGHSPLQLGDKTDLSTDNLDPLKSNDLERAAAGDLLEELDGGHEVDKTKVGPQAGGGIATPGRGGETVTRDRLDPSEKALLRKYFD